MSWLTPTDPGGVIRAFFGGLSNLLGGGGSSSSGGSGGRGSSGGGGGGGGGGGVGAPVARNKAATSTAVVPPTSVPPTSTPPAPPRSGRSSGGGSTAQTTAVAPLPPPPSPEDWLTSYLPAQIQKNQVDLDLEQTLADMLFQRNQFERQNATSLNELNRLAPIMYEDIANQFAGRGLLNSSLYSRADDRAFQNVQNQRTTLAQALSDYIANYDRTRQQLQQQAEQQKRGIEAEALQRYQQLYGQFA